MKLSGGLTIGISASPLVAGQTLTITANMASGTTGTVTLADNGTTLATVPVSSGKASYSTSTLTVGSHVLGVSYSGDSTYMAISGSYTETVLAASSNVVSSSLNPAVVGQSVRFTAAVTPATATGTVTFYDSGVTIGTAPLVSGAAVFTTASLAAGGHSISAYYAGDSNAGPAQSASLYETVKAPPAMSLASSANPSTVGQAVIFTATITPSTATGSVQFMDGGTLLGTVTAASGAAAFSTSQLAQGTHSITAVYSGDANDAAATSATLTETLNLTPPSAPSNLRASAAGSSQMNLAWTATPTGGVTYNVYASTSSGFTPSASNRIASGVATAAYAGTGLTASTTYYFRVTAVNSAGESAATNQASATTTGNVACHVSYSVTSQWNDGFNGAFSIQNTGTTALKSWTLTWTWPGNQKVTQSWNANYSQSGENVTFTNESYNAQIAPGATLSGMGFGGSFSGTNHSPTAFYVNGTLCH